MESLWEWSMRKDKEIPYIQYSHTEPLESKQESKRRVFNTVRADCSSAYCIYSVGFPHRNVHRTTRANNLGVVEFPCVSPPMQNASAAKIHGLYEWFKWKLQSTGTGDALFHNYIVSSQAYHYAHVPCGRVDKIASAHVYWENRKSLIMKRYCRYCPQGARKIVITNDVIHQLLYKKVCSVRNVIKISYRVPAKMGSSVVSLTLILLAVCFTTLQVVIAQGERESLPVDCIKIT